VKLYNGFIFLKIETSGGLLHFMAIMEQFTCAYTPAGVLTQGKLHSVKVTCRTYVLSTWIYRIYIVIELKPWVYSWQRITDVLVEKPGYCDQQYHMNGSGTEAGHAHSIMWGQHLTTRTVDYIQHITFLDITVLWDVMPHTCVNRYQCVAETCCPQI
jgi:hypothetical protein